MSTMGFSKIGYCNGAVKRYRSWNPFGMGCSGGCDGCWARALSKRLAKAGCPDCLAFRPHMHRERLGQPSRVKKPSFVLCNFTNDWMDPTRGDNDLLALLNAAVDADRHTYIMLTKQAGHLAAFAEKNMRHGRYDDNWFIGLTITSQADADAKLDTFLQTPGNLWISYEPAAGPVDWRDWFTRYGETGFDPECDYSHLRGLICGHDNRRGAPGTGGLWPIRQTVEQCDAAGVNVYVKQLWRCFTDGTRNHWKLLRASHPDEYALYPDWAKRRDLPWAKDT